MLREAQFICHPEQPPDDSVTFRSLVTNGPQRRSDGHNRWYLYRHSFCLKELPQSAATDITVDGRYQLFLNGRLIARGPCRSTPEYQRVDSINLGPQLQPGNNTLAILVHVYGVDTAWYEQSRDYWQSVLGDGGVYVVLRGLNPAASTGEPQTAEEWRCIRCTAWRQDSPRSGWGQDFIEDFDAKEMPEGWTRADFDDSSWATAIAMELPTNAVDQAKGWRTIEAFPTLIPRNLPALEEYPVAPARVVGVYHMQPMNDLPVNERLYQEKALGTAEDCIIDADALLEDDERWTRVRTPPDGDVAIVLEFERMQTAFPHLEIDALGGETLELAAVETLPGDYFGERPRYPTARLITPLDCAHMFRLTPRPGRQYFEKFEWVGFRYLQLVIRDAPQEIRIRHVGATATHFPLDNRGAFACSDKTLNNLWHTGRYTALMCSHDGWEDCPGREKRQWLGDGMVNQQVSAAAFGPSSHPLAQLFLEQAMESQRNDGLLQMFTPGDNFKRSIIIPPFSLYWLFTLRHYFFHSGDWGTLARLYPTAQRILQWFERQRGDRLIADMPYWHFTEWSDTQRDGESASINGLYAGALLTAAELAGYLRYESAAEDYRRTATEIARQLNERHWDATRGAYVDSVDPLTGRQHRRMSQEVNAVMLLWNLAPASRRAQILERCTDPQRLKITAVPPIVAEAPEFDDGEDVVAANTFFAHFVFSAFAQAGRFDVALREMRNAYAPMLATGTSTLWESLSPIASLCHAFSATPVHQLSAHALGVTPSEPGFASAQIAVQTGDLSWAQGVYPTVRGDISVAWKATDTELILDLDLPMPATVIAPPGYRAAATAKSYVPGEHRISYRR